MCKRRQGIGYCVGDGEQCCPNCCGRGYVAEATQTMTSPYRPPSVDLPPEHYTPNRKLKPCPSCDGEPCFNNNVNPYYVTCLDCAMNGPLIDPDGKKWNSIPRRVEVLELLWRVQNVLDNPMLTELEHLGEYADKLRKEMGE